MPFDYQKFDAQCATMTTEGLLKQHKHYTKLSATAMTSTAVSALSMIPTLGLSGLGIAASAPAHHNAKKKKQIVEKYLKARGIEASQATEYANALAANENMNQQGQNQMSYGNQQQGMGGYTGAGPSGMRGPSSPPPMDRKYTYNQDNKDSKSSSSKKGSPPQQENIPPPPPTYDESQIPTYQHQQYGPPQPYSQPQSQQWGSPQGYGSQGGYMSPPPQQGYMSPPPQGYGNSNSNMSMNMNMNGNMNGYQQYCGPQAHLYPNSAMQYQHPRVESRHVHFAQ